MIKVIIFDFFGVFRTDGFDGWLKKHSYGHESKILAATKLHDNGNYSDQEFFEALSTISGQPTKTIEYEMESGNLLNKELVDYVAATLKDTYKIALLSNSSSSYLRNELAKYDLEKYFDQITISSEVGLIKPQSEIFEYVMQKLSASSDECVFIDDNPRHVKAAEKIGMHAIVYSDVDSLRINLQEILTENLR